MAVKKQSNDHKQLDDIARSIEINVMNYRTLNEDEVKVEFYPLLNQGEGTGSGFHFMQAEEE